MKRGMIGELAHRLFDVVVIGGGITGVNTAREAALRGLSVALVEKDDFGAGTSSRSSKLIHGGLRYLETYQFKLVAEALQEREDWLRLAPHLTEVRPFLYLLYAEEKLPAWKLNLGLTFYAAASGHWLKRRQRILSPEEVQQVEPHLARAGLRGAGLYYDVLTDDSRLTLEVALGAAEAGAVLINHAAVTGLLLDEGRAHGVQVTDRITGESFELRARQVLNATGPWTDRTRALESGEGRAELRPTKGVHIVVNKSDFPLNHAVFLRSPDDGRTVWPIPSLEDDRVYIGTTDTDFTGDPDDVHPDESDIDYLLNVANRTIPAARLTRDHVVGSWAGLRPLVAPPPGTSTGNTSREHEISTGPTGMLTICGGKLTSSRRMARQFIDAAEAALGTRKSKSHKVSNTPLPGGSTARAAAAHDRAAKAGVPSDILAGWLRRYGSRTEDLLDRWLEDPANTEVIGPRGLTRAELGYLLDDEMVQSLDDLMIRRTSVFFWDSEGGLGSIDALAGELAGRLGWDEERTRKEVAGYRELVAKHRPGR